MSQLIRENITIPRLNILEEDDTSYLVQFPGQQALRIIKGTQSKFDKVDCEINIVTSIGLEVRNAVSVYIELDSKIPKPFREVVMVHELREIEYVISQFADAHERAEHDVILYVLKYFSNELAQKFFEWAKAYRERELAKARAHNRISPGSHPMHTSDAAF